MDKKINTVLEEDHIFSFEGVKGNCYIRLSSSTIEDLQEEINNIFNK